MEQDMRNWKFDETSGLTATDGFGMYGPRKIIKEQIVNQLKLEIKKSIGKQLCLCDNLSTM
jgi:hypothetical protein